MASKNMGGKERIIYSNYLDNYEETKNYLKEENGTEPSEQEIWDEINWNDSIMWEYAEDDMVGFFETRIFVLRGTNGRWDGKHDAGAIIRNFEDLRPAWRDCDYLKLYDLDGHFMIKSDHHDGSNQYEIRELNKQGLRFLARHEDDMSARALHEKLWNPRYSKLPNYANTVWGCPKKQAVS